MHMPFSYEMSMSLFANHKQNQQNRGIIVLHRRAGLVREERHEVSRELQCSAYRINHQVQLYSLTVTQYIQRHFFDVPNGLYFIKVSDTVKVQYKSRGCHCTGKHLSIVKCRYNLWLLEASSIWPSIVSSSQVHQDSGQN